MKKLILIALISVTHFSVSAAGRTCVLDEENVMLSTLAQEVDADCSWSITEVVEENILKECSNAPREIGVYIRNESLRFTEYSFTYDVHEPFYFCKNKTGYKAYHSQLVSLLRSEVRENNASYARSSYSRASVEVEVEKEVQWRCVIPNYVPIPKVYSQAQKETLEFTYGNDHRFKCARLK